MPMSDLRNAARGLIRTPAVSISAILCLALGLGVTTAISSAIDRALLEPLPFRDPGRLVTVFRTTPQFNTGPFSAPNYLDLARDAHQLEGLAAIGNATMVMALPEQAVQTTVLRVTGNLFPLLGMNALHGRMLGPADDDPAAAPVVVVSDALWRRQFAADPSLVGRTVTLDGVSTTVVGIAPADFRVPHGGRVLKADLWVPMRFSEGERARRSSNYLMTMGRLARGATIASAQAEMNTLMDGLASAYPDLQGEGIRVLDLQAESVAGVRTPLMLLFGAVGFVLLIAATNVASLLLARGVQRRREMAIRTALGGGRWAVMRPVLTESLLLSTIGAGLGLGLAWLGVRTIGKLAAQRLPQLAGLSIDLRVLGFALALSLVVALLCGALPAWRAGRVDPQDALRGGRGSGAGREHHRSLGALVVAEVALSLVLLIGAGLVMKGFVQLIRQDPGFDPKPMLTLRAVISPEKYANNTQVQRFLEPALARIRQIPGVANASANRMMPYVGWGWNFNVRYEGRPVENRTQAPLVEVRVVTPEWFAVTGQRLLEGRLLRESDDERDEAPNVVVVNEALVKRDFKDEDPIGKRIQTGDSSYTTIVGVVSDIRNFGPYQAPRPEVYWSYRQAGAGDTWFPIIVRVNGDDPSAVTGPVLAALREADPGVAISDVMPMTDVIGASVGQPRFYLSLLGVFAAVAVVLAVAGIYGVMSYSVAQRTRDLGIRAALGSTAPRTMRFVARQGMVLVAIGVGIGLGGGALVTRTMQTLLYGVSPLDVLTWTLATLALVLAGLVATLIPAQRATRVDPMVAIRTE